MLAAFAQDKSTLQYAGRNALLATVAQDGVHSSLSAKRFS